MVPSFALNDRMYSMPSTPAIASSIGVATALSIGQSVGTDIVGGHDNFRRGNGRKLSDWKALREHDSDNNNENRNYDRGDWPIDEES
jgi:hypothetical protein